MPPRSDSDSDTEEDKRRAQQMRESIEGNAFAFSKGDREAAAAAAATANAAAAASAATAAAAAASATAAAISTSTSLLSSNPFASLLSPPPSCLLSLPCRVVSGPLLQNPHRLAFLDAVTRASRERSLAFDRRRRAGLHGLVSKRLSSATDSSGETFSYTPRVFSEFERRLGRNLEAYLASNMIIEEGVWPDVSEEQWETTRRIKREAEDAFRLTARADNAPLETAGMEDSSATTHVTAASVHKDSNTDEVDKRAKKQARKEQRAREDVATASTTTLSTNSSALRPSDTNGTDAALPAAHAVDTAMESESDRHARKERGDECEQGRVRSMHAHSRMQVRGNHCSILCPCMLQSQTASYNCFSLFCGLLREIACMQLHCR